MNSRKTKWSAKFVVAAAVTLALTLLIVAVMVFLRSASLSRPGGAHGLQYIHSNAAGVDSGQHRLPWRTRVVNLYWLHHSDDFSYINYKSLESVLVHYPNASVVVRLVGPEQADYYKIGTLISKQVFQKYSKQGHDVTVQVRFARAADRSNSSLPGWTFWTSTFSNYYGISKINKMGNLPPAPLYLAFYDRLVSLRENGGISTDFDWIHLDRVDRAMGRMDAGILLKTLCTSAQTCAVSTVMAIASGFHPVVECLLQEYEHYNRSEGLGDCVSRDRYLDGVFCLQSRIDRCFSATQTPNFFAPLQSSKSCGQYYRYEPYSTMPLAIPPDLFEDYPAPREMRLWRSPIPENSQWNSWAESAALPLLWLGRRAVDGDWTLPAESSLLFSIINENNAVLNARVRSQYPSNLALQTSWMNRTNPGSGSSSNSHGVGAGSGLQAALFNVSCSHYHVYDPPSSTSPPSSAAALQSVAAQARASCAPHFVIPGFMKAGSSFLFETLVGHPLIVRALRGAQFKETGCYLAQRMTPPLVSSRMNCFPFVEPHDSITFGDATVYYANSPNTPHQLLLDNPSIKVLFAIRHPIDRIESQHRFDYRAYKQQGIPSINDCLCMAMDPAGKLFTWYQAARGALSEYHASRILDESSNQGLQQLLRLYSRGLKKNVPFVSFRCNSMILHSLYFLPIYRWYQAIPAAQIRVIPTELLDPRSWSKETKLRRLQELPVVENVSLEDAWSESSRRVRTTGNGTSVLKTSHLTPVDRKYLLHQFNALYR